MPSKPGYNSYARDPALSGTLPSASLVTATATAAANNSKAEPSSSASVATAPSSSPYYTSLVAYVGQTTGMSVAQAERAVGWSAITGTGLVAARVALYAYRSLRGDGRIDDEISDCTTEVPKDDRVPKDVVTKPQRRTASYSILGLIRRTLRRILLEESEFIARAPSAITDDMTETNEESEGSLVSHQGSCHCESIQFTVLAPRVLTAQDGPGKIQFRHTQVKASNFRIYAGYEHLKSYYVFYHATGTGNKGAHAFCERCGVHVLYAPSKSTPYLSINVRCLRDDDAHKIKLTSKKDGISEGIPVAGQFDNVNFSDHLSTISEVTQPFHFQMNHNHNHNHNSFNSNNFNSSFNNNNHHQHQRPPTNRHVQQQQQQQQQRSELESSIVSVDGAIEVFYPNQPEKRFRRQLQRPMTPTTSSLTTTEEAESSGSLYKGQMNEMEMMIPTSPAPRSGGASSSFGGVDDFSFTGESVSLMDPDNLSISSPKSGTISIRRNTKMRTAENQNPNGVPRHPTVTSPETRNKMKFFMSKYKKQSSAAGAAAGTN